MSFFFEIFRSTIIVLVLILSSCNNNGLNVDSFDPFTNYQNNIQDTIYHLKTDLTDAVFNGIEIPTKKQTSNGYFTFKFKVENTSSEIKKYYYKIFYFSIVHLKSLFYT